MSARERAGLTVLVLLTIAAPVVAGLAVYGAVPEAHAAHTSFGSLAADSAAGDAAALAALPDGLIPVFAIRRFIVPEAGLELPLHECIRFTVAPEGQVRRRLQLRLPDSSAAVLFASAEEETGALQRVELLRRVPGQGQRGFIWERARDRTTSVWWFETSRGLSRRAERGPVPRGSPVPRAVRALGRQLFAGPCADSAGTGAPNSPMNPISGSRR